MYHHTVICQFKPSLTFLNNNSLNLMSDCWFFFLLLFLLNFALHPLTSVSSLCYELTLHNHVTNKFDCVIHQDILAACVLKIHSNTVHCFDYSFTTCLLKSLKSQERFHSLVWILNHRFETTQMFLPWIVICTKDAEMDTYISKIKTGDFLFELGQNHFLFLMHD